MKKISFKLIAFAMALSICFSVVYSDYTYAIDLPKFVYDDDKTLAYNAINLISVGCSVGGFVVAPGNPALGFGLEGSALIGKFFLHLMDTYGWGDKPKEEQDELIKDYLKTAVTYNSSTKQYTISDSFNDDLHIVVNNYMKETTGYYYYDVPSINDISVSVWSNKKGLDTLKEIMSNFDYCFLDKNNWGKDYFRVAPISKPVYHESYSYFNATNEKFSFINDDWSLSRPLFVKVINESKAIKTTSTVSMPKNYTALCLFDYDFVKDIDYSVDDLTTYSDEFSKFALQRGTLENGYVYSNKNFCGVFALERSQLRIWYDLNKYKEFDLGKQPYYASQEWYNYDYSNTDNSTYSESFIDNSIKDSNNHTTYNEIVNNYNDGMTEKEVADLVETIMKNQREINNNTGNDNGSGSGGSTSGGSGLGALLDGIGSIFDFLGTLIGNIIGFIADLLKTTMDSISSVTGSLGGLGDAFASVFSFLPPEVIGIITGGLSLMITLGIIKFLLK